jgi:ABC-type uncharacterized transport system permease subunit
MLGLPLPETIVFAIATVMYAAAAVIGVLQLRADGEKYRHFMQPLVCTAIVFEAIVLVFRAVAMKAIPLTGLFESMIVLTIVFGLTYLFLSIAIRQVWFSSVIVWVILAIILMTWAAARPASEPAAVAATPWAMAHGIAMIFAAVSVTFATANACLYLIGNHKLKHKKIMQVLGKVPNMEKLEHMNLFGIRAGFVFITIGLISGFGMALLRLAMLGISIGEWLTDIKIICIITSWALLAVILVLNRLRLLKDKARAVMTIIVFILVLFAILGVTILGATHHNFSG